MPAIIAVLTLLLLPAFAPALADAAAKPLACQPGQVEVRVAQKGAKKKARKARTRSVCRTVIGPRAQRRDATATLRAVGIRPTRMRDALPRRMRKRIPLAAVRRVEQAVAKRSAVARAARRPLARAAAAGDCSTPPTPGPAGQPQTDGGTTVTTTTGSWGEPRGATWGTTVTVTAETSADGGTATRSQTTKTCVSWDSCPDAEGRVTGTGEYSLEQTTVAAKGGVRVSTRTQVRLTMKLVGHVGGDARVKTFDWSTEGTAISRGDARQNGKVVKVVTGPTVRLVASKAGVDPRGRVGDPNGIQVRSWGTGGSVLDGTSEAAWAGAEALAAMSVGLSVEAANALLGAERVWYDQAACLDVVFDPQPAQAEPSAHIPVAMKVRAKDGQDVAAEFTLEAASGSVTPRSGTTPATATWTAPEHVPEQPMNTFALVAVSKRGRALGTHTAVRPKARWWKVTFEGADEYGRHEPRGTIPQLWSGIHFRFRMVSEPARMPPLGAPGGEGITGSQVADVSGDANATRVDGGGTSTCASALDGAGHVGQLRVRADGDGFRVRPTPFAILYPTDRSCLFDDMLIWMGNEIQDAMTPDVHVSQAELDAHDRIEKPVTGDASPYCWGGTANGDWPCTQNVKWQGRVVLERVPPPAGMEP